MSPRTLIALLITAVPTLLFAVLGAAILFTDPRLGPVLEVVERFALPTALLQVVAISAGLLFLATSLGWLGVLRLISLGHDAARRGALLMGLGSALLLLPSLIDGRPAVGLLLLPLPLLLIAPLPNRGPATGWPAHVVIAGSTAALVAALTIVG